MIIGCGNHAHLSNEDETLLLNKYLIEFKDKNWSISRSISDETKSKTVTSMIDRIIHEVEKQGKLDKSREVIVNYIHQYLNDSKRINHEIDSFLVFNLVSFEKENLTFVQELNFIDKFIDLVYWDKWSCNLSTNRVIRYMPKDTVLLYEDSNYDLPIRLEYMESSCGFTILSNSLQTISPNQVSFKTDKKITKIQKVYFTCKVRNDVTKEVESLKDSLVVKLIAKNDQ